MDLTRAEKEQLFDEFKDRLAKEKEEHKSEIKLELYPYCNGCPVFIPKTVGCDFYANGEIIGSDTRVICGNKALCDHIKKHLEKEINNEQY